MTVVDFYQFLASPAKNTASFTLFLSEHSWISHGSNYLIIPQICHDPTLETTNPHELWVLSLVSLHTNELEHLSKPLISNILRLSNLMVHRKRGLSLPVLLWDSCPLIQCRGSMTPQAKFITHPTWVLCLSWASTAETPPCVFDDIM